MAKNTLKMPNLLSSEEIAEREDAAKRAKFEARLVDCRKNANFPRRHIVGLGAIQEVSEWRSAADLAMATIGDGDSLLLCGKRGTGKTQIAVWCGKELIERDAASVRYLKASQLFRETRESMHDGKESRYIDALVKLGLLIVDEAHVRVDSDYEDRTLTEIVDRRYDDIKPTILITNQSKVEASKSFGPSIVSRYTESGRAIECNWKSFRVG